MRAYVLDEFKDILFP
jgi:hypothetical protein